MCSITPLERTYGAPLVLSTPVLFYTSAPMPILYQISHASVYIWLYIRAIDEQASSFLTFANKLNIMTVCYWAIFIFCLVRRRPHTWCTPTPCTSH